MTLDLSESYTFSTKDVFEKFMFLDYYMFDNDLYCVICRTCHDYVDVHRERSSMNLCLRL